jgi:hypothetical protein
MEKFIFDHGFLGFSSWLACLLFWTGDETVYYGRTRGTKLLTSWQLGCKETEKEESKKGPVS